MSAPATVYAKASYPLKEVAEMTGLSYRRIADGCRRGLYRHAHDGTRVMTPSQIEEMLAKVTEEPASEAAQRYDTGRARAAKRVARAAGRAA